MHANDHFPPHGYIMYIGITGEEALHRTLNDRFYEYLKEQRRNKRPKVHYMLAKYSDDLFFNYVPIADDTFDLGQLEADLNDAIIPPVVEKDFSAEVRAVVKAFRS
ncbi:hypothetical protein BWQ93_03295 [Sphingopyxis sp. QXT-31]|nr:hypothetical protein BWQ93_03295 [Sphingopyxis sp. QXT-31]